MLYWTLPAHFIEDKIIYLGTFLFRMDWTESSLHKEKRVKLFFTIWQKFIEILRNHIKSKIEECFGLMSWHLEQQLAGVTEVQCWLLFPENGWPLLLSGVPCVKWKEIPLTLECYQFPYCGNKIKKTSSLCILPVFIPPPPQISSKYARCCPTHLNRPV